MNDTPDLAEHAQRLAQLGFPVLPLHWPCPSIHGVTCSCGKPDCKSIGKHPLTAHGVKDASTDRDVIREWWEHFPDANIGIATGHVCDVIDIDGTDAYQEYLYLVARHGYPELFASVITGRDGGVHFYTNGAGYPSWTGGLNGWPKHLDGKGLGGYVVAPPSLHASGKRYKWIIYPGDARTEDTVPWPEWAETVHASFPVAQSRNVSTGIESDSLVIAQPAVPVSGNADENFCRTVITRIHRDVTMAPDGARWQTLATTGLWDLAGLVHGGHLARDEAVTVAQDMAGAIGLDPAEVRRVAAEMDRALGKRRDPIQASHSHAHGPGAGTLAGTPGNGNGAVSGPHSGPVQDGGHPPALSAEFEAQELARQTAAARIRILANDAARKLVQRETLGEQKFVAPAILSDLMTQPVPAIRYRIEGLWPADGRIVLAAQYKAGKSTLAGNLIRSLADGTPFLGRFPVMPVQRNIALIDTEMSTGKLREWLGAQGIERTDKVILYPMRGHVATFDLQDDEFRAHWVQELKSANIEVLILDCLGPVFGTAGIDESPNKEVGQFLAAFETLLSDAGISEALIVHHMGHNGERARGASRLRDWPDAEWQLIREGQEDDTAPAPDARRYFRAYGRDVDCKEELLHYEPNMRWLSLGTEGNRKAVRAHAFPSAVLEHVERFPGQTVREIREQVKGRNSDIGTVIAELVQSGQLETYEIQRGKRWVVGYFLPGTEHENSSDMDSLL